MSLQNTQLNFMESMGALRAQARDTWYVNNVRISRLSYGERHIRHYSHTRNKISDENTLSILCLLYVRRSQKSIVENNMFH